MVLVAVDKRECIECKTSCSTSSVAISFDCSSANWVVTKLSHYPFTPEHFIEDCMQLLV